MSDVITPALSAEEWRSGRVEYFDPPIRPAAEQGCQGLGFYRDGDGVTYSIGYEGCDRDEAIPRPHALAALCLYGQPFGFTREDVDAIRNADGGDMERNRFLDNIAARIAALLPPEDTK